MIEIDKNTEVKIKCHKCGNEYSMDMMRIGLDSKNLICRNCLERRPVQKQEQAKAGENQEDVFKEYFCKECKYNFKRAKHVTVSACPYCGSSGSIMVKGSTAKIMADAFKMKDNFGFR